ncbi:hypothetical protein [Chitinilyticum litopenaei]|uniref:hypothetical protein n=1 Tax=Chitinilyticum litopenaei TaxID=1121276 RepID=UPI000421BB14|nr:hypothetical protein [Chitinilyticum litopenaei]
MSTTASADIDQLLLQSRELAFANPQDALRLAQQAAQQAEQGRAYRELIAAQIQVMGLLFNLGNLHEGGEWLMKALTVAETHDLHPEHGYLLVQLGILHYTLGENEEALDYWTDCLDYSNPLFSNAARINAHIGTGQIYYAYGQYADALRHHHQARALLRADIAADLRAAVLINLAADCNQLDDFAGMAEALDEAERITRASGHLNYLGEVCYYQTLLALARNDPATASRYAAEGASMRNICVWSEISNLIAQAQIRRLAGDSAGALQILLTALERSEATRCDHHLFLVYRQVAALCHELGDFTQSAHYHRLYQEQSQKVTTASVLAKLAILEAKLHAQNKP